MDAPETVVRGVGAGNTGPALRFLIDWVVSGDEGEARAYLAGHTEPEGVSLIATNGRPTDTRPTPEGDPQLPPDRTTPFPATKRYSCHTIK